MNKTTEQMEITKSKIDVIAVQGRDYFGMEKEFDRLRNLGWEPLVRLTGEHPVYYFSVYKPTKKTFTKFEW